MAKAKEPKYKKKQTTGMKILTVIFTVVSIFYVMPVIIVLYNSFKTNSGIARNLFALPNAETFHGFENYVKGMTFGNYPFWEAALWSTFITIGGVVLILFCTSMAAWYIQRSNTIVCKIIYFFCIFSMVVPFQMVMFTLSDTANRLNLITPWGILLIYLGFGAGLAIFMFSGFVKSIPIEIEEAADVDGAGPLRTFFGVVLPIMKPTFISVAILETMWIWNDYPPVPYPGRQALPHHTDPHAVPQRQLRPVRPRRDHGARRAEHTPDRCLLLRLSEVHHRGRYLRRCQGLIPFSNIYKVQPYGLSHDAKTCGSPYFPYRTRV